MSFADIVFLCIIIVTMGGALTAVLAGSIVYALMGLVAAMFGVAGLYVYLNSPFLAMMQMNRRSPILMMLSSYRTP